MKHQIKYMENGEIDCTKSEHFTKISDLKSAFPEAFSTLPNSPDITPERDFSDFRNIMLAKILDPLKIGVYLKKFIESHLGERVFTEGTRFDISENFLHSKNTTPFLFLITPQSDPIQTILA